jgi:hypothetical protein
MLNLVSLSELRTVFECQAHAREIWRVVQSPDGTAIVTGGSDKFVRWWQRGKSKKAPKLKCVD